MHVKNCTHSVAATMLVLRETPANPAHDFFAKRVSDVPQSVDELCGRKSERQS